MRVRPNPRSRLSNAPRLHCARPFPYAYSGTNCNAASRYLHARRHVNAESHSSRHLHAHRVADSGANAYPNHYPYP